MEKWFIRNSIINLEYVKLTPGNAFRLNSGTVIASELNGGV